MLNKVQLIGRITNALESQYIHINNEQITKIDFNLAINNKDKVQFIHCVAFRNQAENMSKYLHKGSKIYIEGTLSIQKYTNNENQNKTNTKVILNNVIFLDNNPPTQN
ncbi:single-stranded DNA-binding protein [Candidatus Phytoplasma luffae]|uniref:Single-stranded DNA-binding protein n=1 Tax=Loofah witches'-broom phytoplasma TaxID=35773 RepID=A0A975FIS8_LOWBP|nr:single-stranded DNA-binding protein [Candidatus Phytoplasma luffae]QTX02596.1 single-stranded DNA-binding protein [Candidatus Phytoplasma luffae]QTX02624.1 single-stranded DNA-binding protein [Candidatus Phytoplasma luffae]QTX02731.1 single-stranded DNA-binding protein [Candidatus Phytoplasma luffae]QTX02862.1 single-stranded DNA-binding protein [Candidatus Phytoplasma luffae]QTX02913.1 single-stranded DNA-binding protein [Candidatus Phytoplasma luffae]